MEHEYAEKVFPRFITKVSIPQDINKCWIWKANKDKDGYGKIKVKVETNGQMVFRNLGAHIFMWMYFNGDKPNGLIVMHKCDNPSCVNPSHLKIGTYKDNSQDRDRKGRSNHAKGEQLSSPGEKNPNCRLTKSQVDTIRERYSKGDISQQKLADEYGVAQAHISYITRRKGWK